MTPPPTQLPAPGRGAPGAPGDGSAASEDDLAELRQPDGDPAPPELAEAPPVVAVVVAHEPGPWFEEALAGIGAQDYPNLSVLVIDAGSPTPVVPRVADVLPAAYVRRLEGNPGFAAAANEVLELVDGAAFLLLCHDDVCPDPGALRALVEEAFRSNAGIVGPKIVSWDAPASLLQVGQSADKTGVPAPLNERDELDQEQHDGVRDVFTIPGACTLVRADLFRVLGGFDAAITFLGEDLDLCWRAQVAGARVVVAPDARVRHRESLPARRPVDDRRRLLARHRLRTVLTCYGPVHLVRVLPWAIGLALVEALYALVTGHVAQAKDVAGAWTWNLRRLGELRRRRRAVRTTRRLPDGEVRRLQVRGSARLAAYLRGELGASAQVRSLAGLGRELTGSLTSRRRRPALLTVVVLGAVLAFGSRDLLGDRLVVGGIVPLGGAVDLLRSWTSGYRGAGLGAVGPSPGAFGLLGLAGVAALGRMGALHQVLVLGMVPIGLVGTWRLTAPLGVTRARLVGVVVYATVALPYDALAGGSWATLLLYGAAPWVLRHLLAAGGDEPFADPARPVALLRRLAPLALLVALLAAFVPLLALLVVLVALALGLGAVLAGRGAAAVGPVVLSLGAAVIAAAVHLPWSSELLGPGATWVGLGGIAPLAADRIPLTDLLRFGSGTTAPSLLGWSAVVVGTLPLLLGRGWRFTAAVQAWTVAIACWALADLAGRGSLPVPLPAASVLLVPAAVALALAAALGVVAFEQDLRGYRFGWRQVASIVAGMAVVVGTLPALVGAFDGRWGAPSADFTGTLDFTRAADVVAQGGHRTLWVGHPAALPAGGERLTDELAFAVVDAGTPTVVERWNPPGGGPGGLAAEALRLAAAGRTDRLGRLLAPLGIRYLALPTSVAPDRAGAPRRPLPQGLLATVDRQLDLRAVDVDLALGLYENAAWAPVRSSLDPDTAGDLVGGGAADRPTPDLTEAVPVLPDRGLLGGAGPVGAGTVYLSEAASPGWRLEVDGRSADRRVALGWANAFAVPTAGDATLRHRTAPIHLVAVAVQAGLWLALVAAAVVGRRERRS